MSDDSVLETLGASDIVVPFRLESSGLRGRLARLGPCVDAVLSAHNYPEPVSRILGEALTLTALIGAALKFEGIFTLQAQGDGPIGLLVADYETAKTGSGGALRGYAGFDAAAVAQLEGRSLAALFGKGALALTIDPKLERERYQGIVPLEGERLSDAARLYFDQSEQIPTLVMLSVARRFAPDAAAKGPTKGEWRAGGLMVQIVPAEGGGAVSADGNEDFTRARLLAETVSDDELVDPTLRADRLLYRLFHEEGVRVFAPTPVHFDCRCSAERLKGVLISYPKEELEDMAEAGAIHATCQFCSKTYSFPLDALSSNPASE
jgi:molecular chaperone Hsp33